jgi:hypothetical protein
MESIGPLMRQPFGNSAYGQLERGDFSSNRHPALSFCLGMIFSENRYPLFRIMLLVAGPDCHRRLFLVVVGQRIQASTIMSRRRAF